MTIHSEDYEMDTRFQDHWVIENVSSPREELKKVQQVGDRWSILGHNDSGLGEVLAWFLLGIIILAIVVPVICIMAFGLLIMALNFQSLSIQSVILVSFFLIFLLWIVLKVGYRIWKNRGRRIYIHSELLMPEKYYRKRERMKFRYSASSTKAETEVLVHTRLVCLDFHYSRQSDLCDRQVLWKKDFPVQHLRDQGFADFSVQLPAEAPLSYLGRDQWTLWQLYFLVEVGGRIIKQDVFTIEVVE